MSTFYHLLLSIGRGNLSNHELAFLAAHCAILDNGLQLSLEERTFKESNQLNDKQADFKEAPAKNREMHPNSTYPLVKTENNSISMVILPPKWKLTDPLKQAYSVNYNSPLKSINEYQGPKSLSLKAIVIADKIVFHITDSKKPENLISFDLSLSAKHIEELADSLKTPIPSSTEHTKAEAVYVELYTILHSHLSNSKEIKVPTNVKSESTPTPRIPNTPTTPESILLVFPRSSPRPITEPSPSEYIGPDDPIFGNRGFDPLRGPPGVNIEPIDPINPLGNLIDGPVGSRDMLHMHPMIDMAHMHPMRDRPYMHSMRDPYMHPRRPRDRSHMHPNRPRNQDMDDDLPPRLGGPGNTFL